MRHYKKKELLKLVETLKHAHSQLEKLIKHSLYEEMLTLLSQCQEAAIQIGTEIEQSEGEGLSVVHILEDYCETLYKISQTSNDKNSVMQNLKMLNKQLLQFEKEIKYDIPSRLEIAFFPYKASMWDSLESIYFAAAEDTNCDIYVVPIPYYDKNPDGSLARLNYEGDQYPSNIPITSWEEYNLEEHRPDIAYIHNPYDNTNNVTSVHPVYYSKNLKKYVDMLVYVPYFVVEDDVPEHFCDIPGVIWSDRVIVQSEKVRNTYIRVYNKTLKDVNLLQYFVPAEKKFLALGSPKFDKVINTKREDVEVPEEWKRLIYY